MKVTLQITKKPKKGSVDVEARYEGVSPDSFVAVRLCNQCWSYYKVKMTDDLELLCLKFGVNYEAWTQVWVRLRVKEQKNDSSQNVDVLRKG